jgi:hypothetical protein
MASASRDQLTFEGLFVPPAPTPKPADLGQAVRRALSEALKGAARKGTPRKGLAERISAAACREVSVHMLDRFAAQSCENWRLPAELVPAIAQATGDRKIVELLAEACGGRVLWGDEAAVAELGALHLQERDARARRRLLDRALPPARRAEVLDGLRGRLGGAGG